MNIGKFERTFDEQLNGKSHTRVDALKLALEEAVMDELRLDQELREAKEIEDNKAKALVLDQANGFLKKAFENDDLLEAFSPQLTLNTELSFSGFSVSLRFTVMGQTLMGHFKDGQLSLRGCICESPQEFYRNFLGEALAIARSKREHTSLPANLHAKRFGE